jgi:uncharacterized membrane protein
MNSNIVLDFLSLFCVGILAGALLVIDYGVGRAIVTVADDQLQIQMRQALIRTLRILVPSIFILTILLGLAAAIVGGADTGSIFRWAGAALVVICFVLTLIGTAPINKAIGSWQASAPPKNWRALISRWQRLDIVRTWMGVIAFALLLTATALQLTAH